jgi:predicted RNA-binding Zn-ribbon protein involved in translation (DUF1610 family)
LLLAVNRAKYNFVAILYKLKCENCGKELCEASDGEFVLHGDKEISLPHPCEDEKLKELGLSREKAALQGRLILHTSYVCSQCGWLQSVRSLILPATGPLFKIELIVWMVFLVFISAMVIFYSLSILGAAICIAIYLLLATIGRGFILAKWVEHKFGFTEDKICEHCGSSQLVNIAKYLRDKKAKLYCDECGKRGLVCTNIALS